MPATDESTVQYEYLMGSAGVNLHSNLSVMNPQECISSQNLVYKNGMVKREGSSKYTSVEVSAGSPIVGLHKFMYSTSEKIIASSGTAISYWDGAAWQVIDNTRTANTTTHFTTWLNRCYVSNGVDAPFKWTLAGGMVALSAFPSTTIQTLAYQDRLLIISNNNPGDLQWTAAFDDSIVGSVADIGVRPDSRLYGMCLHGSSNASSGLDSKVLLAGAKGMYLFSGSSLRWPALLGDYVIHKVSSVGCVSPKTMVSTPEGTIWLGVDKQVYMLPYDAIVPLPIATKIRSNISGVNALERASLTHLPDACAAYNDEYYKLSFTSSGGSNNNTQYWLDVPRMVQDENRHWGPWYGPMTGQSILCFASGPNIIIDGLLGGEASAGVGSFIYTLDEDDIYSDSGTAFETVYQTPYARIGNVFFAKDIHEMELELLDVGGSITIDYHDLNGTLKTGDIVPLTGTAVYWDDLYWDEFYWNSTYPARVKMGISPAIQPRMLSIIVKHTSATETFQLYSIRVAGVEQSLTFA